MKAERIMKTLWIIPVFVITCCSTSVNSQTDSDMNTPITLENLPTRAGERPATTNTNPHTQLNQQPSDLSHVEVLKEWAFKLSNIERRPSAISVPGAVAMCMDDAHTCDSCNAFMIGTEFAHFHPAPDHSMHLGLPKSDAEIIIDQGWGEWHPLIKRGFLPPNIIMMYAPRNEGELEVAKFILGRSYDYAQGRIE
ncbi:MAG: phospholipase [Bacteroidota bacterium]